MLFLSYNDLKSESYSNYFYIFYSLDDCLFPIPADAYARLV